MSARHCFTEHGSRECERRTTRVTQSAVAARLTEWVSRPSAPRHLVTCRLSRAIFAFCVLCGSLAPYPHRSLFDNRSVSLARAKNYQGAFLWWKHDIKYAVHSQRRWRPAPATETHSWGNWIAARVNGGSEIIQFAHHSRLFCFFIFFSGRGAWVSLVVSSFSQWMLNVGHVVSFV